MPNFIDTTDDALLTDGSQSFGGGADEQVDPGLLEGTACAEMKNIALNRFGVAVTRKGCIKVGDAAPFVARIQGLAELDTASTEVLLCVSGGAFKELVGTTWTAESGWSADASADMVNMVQGVNLLYVADGVGNLRSFDGTTWTDLTTGSGNAPIGNLLAWHTSRMFLSGVSANNDTVYVSDILEVGAGHWNWTTNSFRVGGGEGDAIMAIAAWTGYKLVVFKNNSFYVVEANPTESVAQWVVERISPVIGCVAHRSVVQVGNDLFFLSRDGVRSVIRTVTTDQNEVSLPLSWPMQPYIDRINWTYASRSCAAFYDNKYLIAVPLDSATDPNYVLVYDTRAQRWSGYWTGWTPTIFHVSKLANLRNLYFGQSDGKAWEWQADADDDAAASYLDDGTGYASRIKSRAYSFADPLSPKWGWCVNLEFYLSLATASCSAILDQGGDNILDSSFATEQVSNQLPVNLPFNLASVRNKRVALDLATLGEFRSIQIQTDATTGRLALKSLFVSAFPSNMVYEEGGA